MKLTAAILFLVVAFLSAEPIFSFRQCENVRSVEKKSCKSSKKACQKKVTEKKNDLASKKVCAGKMIEKKSCRLEKISCSEKKDSDNAEQPCKNYCNPFMVCSGCLYTLTEKSPLSLLSLSDISVKGGGKTSTFISNYNPDCWHPPRNLLNG